MISVCDGLSVSEELYEFIKDVCVDVDCDGVWNDFADFVREFREENNALLEKRVELQDKIDAYFTENTDVLDKQFVSKLKELGYIIENDASGVVGVADIAEEIFPMAGPQLVVPADKVNMVLNAANARWASLYNSLYSSNIIDSEMVDDVRKKAVKNYVSEFFDKIFTLDDRASWIDVEKVKVDRERRCLVVVLTNGDDVQLAGSVSDCFVGYVMHDQVLQMVLFEHNGLKIKCVLGEDGGIADVLLEAAITYIIDLEDASISVPENKCEGYRIVRGIMNGGLTCEVRGQTRSINGDSEYIDVKTGNKKMLRESAVALVRDVGPHMMADMDMISLDGLAVPEKMLDMFVTSFVGARYHVAPKMHGAEEVELNVRMWERINQIQNLSENANKIGIMNEEMRLNGQLKQAVLAAKDIVFFTNTGFLDYTGSFIDLMMCRGAIAPYKMLPSQLYKTAYEKHNVNVSLELEVPQIGAGMWPAIQDMAGLLKSKEGQVKGLTDTGWSPSPMAAAIHALAFHLFGDVRQMQREYKKDIKFVHVEDMFSFPAADLSSLGEDEILSNIDLAVHGLLAYAEPWVRRSVGCSGVKELSGEPLMEDRATARIKAAFVRNWLVHEVVTIEQVENSIQRMAMIVDEQNSEVDGYVALYNAALEDKRWLDVENVVQAVRDLVLNPDGYSDSYVETYLYAANRRQLS